MAIFCFWLLQLEFLDNSGEDSSTYCTETIVIRLFSKVGWCQQQTIIIQ